MNILRLPFAFLIINKPGWQDYQRRLFDWHCATFFDFRSALTLAELGFIDSCIEHSADTRWLSPYFSLFTYSHKVDPAKNRTNSSRLAYGTLLETPELADLAATLSRDKGWPLDPVLLEDANLPFYGLGWDFEEGIDKIYFFVRDIRALPASLARLVPAQSAPLAKRGILSLSFSAGAVTEEKLYVFPKALGGFATATLHSMGRRVVQQCNNSLFGRRDVSRFSPKSQEIIRAYTEQMGTILDAYSIDEQGIETLYFENNT